MSNGLLNSAKQSLERMMIIDLAKRFSAYPSGRVPVDGSNNGEKFREDFLVPAIQKIKEAGEPSAVLTVDIDGVRSFGSSFLEEAFGGLIRKTKYDPAWVVSVLKIKCTQDHLKMYHDSINEYVQDALKSRHGTN